MERSAQGLRTKHDESRVLAVAVSPAKAGLSVAVSPAKAGLCFSLIFSINCLGGTAVFPPDHTWSHS